MLKKLFAPTDMTKGTPWKSILMFTLPMLIGNIAQQLYSTVDTIVVGRFAENGDNAIAAVGSALPIINMMLVLFIGISAGASVMVSQYFGARNREGLSYTVGNCITVTVIACVFLIAAVAPFLRQILVLLTPPFDRQLQRHLLVTDEMMLAVKRNSEWDREDLKLSELSSARFVSMYSSHSLYRIAHEICGEIGFKPNIAIQSDDPYYMRKYIELGMGVGIVPSVSWRGLFSEDVVLKSIGGIKRETYLFSDPEKYMPTVVKLFLDDLLEVCGESN